MIVTAAHTMLNTITVREANRVNANFLKIFVLAIVVPWFAYQTAGAGADRAGHWSLVISAEPISRAERAHQVTLYSVDQSEHLTGTWFYTNGSVGKQAASTVPVQGEKTADGIFWPDVTLQVKNEATGRWETLATPSRRAAPTTLFVEPNTTQFNLTVNLDPFKPLLTTHKLGRIVLPNGETSEFELKYLLPPRSK